MSLTKGIGSLSIINGDYLEMS